MESLRSTLLRSCFLVAALATAVIAHSAAVRDAAEVNRSSAALERFFQSDRPPLLSYRAHRLLEASTRGGKLSGSLEALTERDENGHFSFEVLDQRGSGLIRQRVLMAALREEERMDNEKADEAALSAANYAFTVIASTDPLVRIDISPHRTSTRLVTGSIFVTPEEGDLIRVEGRLSKAPSFWTRSVDIVRKYERIAGVRVPVEMRSTADVRFVGTSTFSMTYEYISINGNTIAPSGR